jgi:hypothetical protein
LQALLEGGGFLHAVPLAPLVLARGGDLNGLVLHSEANRACHRHVSGARIAAGGSLIILALIDRHGVAPFVALPGDDDLLAVFFLLAALALLGTDQLQPLFYAGGLFYCHFPNADPLVALRQDGFLSPLYEFMANGALVVIVNLESFFRTRGFFYIGTPRTGRRLMLRRRFPYLFFTC